MKIYNTLNKKVEEFKPLEEGKVKMYTCGPTVYSQAHIGNFSAYLFSDLILRWFSSRHLFNENEKQLEVTKISNITDVGHIVGEADEGEDKMEKEAKNQQKSVLDIARHWEEIYHQDEKKLNIIPAKKYTRASEYVEPIIAFVEILIKKELAYETKDGVYFDISKFPEYGKLSGNTLENLSTGAGGRISDEHQANKKNPADFSLWKKCVGINDKHTLRWDSPWGEGFPGWHIECSVMIHQNLGEQIDIHTGGVDNIFPHHECEIAQMESYTGKKFCNYWMHKGFINLNNTKISKSLGNVINLDDCIDKGFSPLDVRYLMLSAHYRQQLNFTWEALQGAKEARNRIQNLWERINKLKLSEKENNLEIFQKRFFNSMEDDLNVSGSLAVVFDFLKETNGLLDKNPKEITIGHKNFLENIDAVFGLLDLNQTQIPKEVQVLLDQRKIARENKNWDISDNLRDRIEVMGFKIKDTGDEQEVKKIK